MSGDEAMAWAHANLPGDPTLVVSAMEDAGWFRAGGRLGVYVRMDRMDGSTPLLVPLKPDYDDYPDLMAAVLAELKATADAGRRAQQVLDALAAVNVRSGAKPPADTSWIKTTEEQK